MSDIDLKIEELQKEVQDNLRRRETVCQELGLFLLNREDDSSEDDLMQEYRNAAEEINSRISLMGQQISEISEIEENLSRLKEQDIELKNRRKASQDNLTLLQESLGEELFHLLNSQDMDVPWKKAFDPLFKSITKIRDNDTELFQTENQVQAKSLFRGLVKKSRMSVLKTRKKSMENSHARLYVKCFNDALLLGAGKGDENSSVAELLAPWFREDKIWQAVLEDENQWEEQKHSNRERLKDLAGARGPRRRIDFLSREQALEEERLGDALKKWGESVTGETPEALKDVEEVKSSISVIDGLTEEAIQLNLRIEKWEARKDIEKLNRDQQYMAEKISTLEEEIQARKQEIRVLKKEMASGAREIEKKKQFAGEADEDESGEPGSSPS